jgi:quercetin dioxygenase-like cupin family protein
MELKPGSTQFSEAHNKGVEKYILVSKGAVSLIVGEEMYHVSKGNALHFSADQPHSLKNPTKQLTEVIIIMNYQ